MNELEVSDSESVGEDVVMLIKIPGLGGGARGEDISREKGLRLDSENGSLAIFEISRGCSLSIFEKGFRLRDEC